MDDTLSLIVRSEFVSEPWFDGPSLGSRKGMVDVVVCSLNVKLENWIQSSSYFTLITIMKYPYTENLFILKKEGFDHGYTHTDVYRYFIYYDI